MTIRIIAPDLYDRRPGVLLDIANHVRELGSRALVLGSKTALKQALPAISSSLQAAGIAFETEVFSGQPTIATIDKVAARLRGLDDAVIIGVGGGKVLDTAKAAGVEARRQIITVPTVAATCAAWAALSVLYSDDGVQIESRLLPYGPRRVLVDPDIVSAAPARFIAAGVADTVVKWFETAPNLDGVTDPLALRLQADFGAFTLATLEHALQESAEGTALSNHPAALADTLDAIIALAGICGSVRGDCRIGGLAHPFYAAATRQLETHDTLHGAIVGFGLLVQLALENKPIADIEIWIERWSRLGLPVRLADFGIVHDVEAGIARLAADTLKNLGPKPFVGIGSEAIAEAIRKIDAIGRAKALERAA